MEGEKIALVLTAQVETLTRFVSPAGTHIPVRLRWFYLGGS